MSRDFGGVWSFLRAATTTIADTFALIGVLFGCFGRKNRLAWFTCHLPGPSISSRRTPMFGLLKVAFTVYQQI